MRELETAKQIIASLGNDMEAVAQTVAELIRDRAVIRDQSIEFAERAILLGARVGQMRGDVDEALGAICQAEVMADMDEAVAKMTPDMVNPIPEGDPIPLDKMGDSRGF